MPFTPHIRTLPDFAKNGLLEFILLAHITGLTCFKTTRETVFDPTALHVRGTVHRFATDTTLEGHVVLKILDYPN